jgi:hypothetical protein
MRKTPEREGFEPSRGSTPLLAFQASAFNRSTTSPQATSSSGCIVAVLAGVLLVGAAPGTPQRHAVAGRYSVPNVYVQTSVAAGAGANALANSGFETGAINDGWFQCGDVPAYAMTAHPHSGKYAEYSGTLNGKGEPLGNSGVCQRVMIPPGGVLTAQLYQLSNEGDATFAYQEADLLDDRGHVVLNLFKSTNERPAWILGRWNLTAYAGHTYWLYFGVHGDGYSKNSTQQFLDDVNLASPAAGAAK